MEETANKTGTQVERNPDGTIKSGALNPHGRPKGKTMKEFARDYYMAKTDEEKRAYIEWLDEKKPGFAWTMGEGNPETKTDITSAGLPIVQVSEAILNKHSDITS
jgi:hypothetical protein